MMKRQQVIFILFLSLILAIRGAARMMRNNDFLDDFIVTAIGIVIALVAAVSLRRSSAK